MDETWKIKAYQTIKEIALSMKEFTVDDVWATGLKKPSEARVLGPIMSKAKNDGLIKKSGRSRPTTQKESHSADVTIWESLIYDQ